MKNTNPIDSKNSKTPDQGLQFTTGLRLTKSNIQNNTENQSFFDNLFLE